MSASWTVGSRVGASLLILGLSFWVSACGDTILVEPDPEVLRSETCIVCDDGSINPYVFSTSHHYGDFYHSNGLFSTDSIVNAHQLAAYSDDATAFSEYSRDWSNPDDEAIAAWPAAVGAAARVGAAAVRGAVSAGRALARTSRIRTAVTQGHRWARDVSVAAAGAMLAGQWPLQPHTPVDSIPISEFDFMFDYASQ